MSHYAKLAALAFRFVAVAGLFYSVPSVLMGVRLMREPTMNGPMLFWSIGLMLLFPLLALILYAAARPLGAFTAKGLE